MRGVDNNIDATLTIIRAGRCMIGQGARQYGQGAAPSEICLAGTLSDDI